MVGRTSSLLSRDIEFQVKALSVPLSLIRRMSGLDRDGFLIWLFCVDHLWVLDWETLMPLGFVLTSGTGHARASIRSLSFFQAANPSSEIVIT